MSVIKTFESYSKSVLVIVDVQKSFGKFFSDNYLDKLKKYCKQFSEVVQIWDNHPDGKNINPDFIYDAEHPEDAVHDDLYHFPNELKRLEKRYTHNVDIDFFKNILTKEQIADAKSRELEPGFFVVSKKDTVIVYVGNNHKWFHLPKSIYYFFKEMKDSGKEVILAGGSCGECLEDLNIAALAVGVNVKINYKYTYSARGSKL
jgi:hypothetical protein